MEGCKGGYELYQVWTAFGIGGILGAFSAIFIVGLFHIRKTDREDIHGSE